MIPPADRDGPASDQGGSSSQAVSSPSPDGKYYIYSSKHSGGEATAHTLLADSNIDNFVTLLANTEIILTAAPTADNLIGKFDTSDSWATWMTCLDTQGALSLVFDSAQSQNITAFRYHFTSPWNMAFTSQDSALLFAFGTSPTDPSHARIPVPGLMPDGKLLYFGLDSSLTGKLTSTVQDLVNFSGTESSIPDVVAGWTVTLDPTGANKKRNAMWFDPVNSMQTTVRLQFNVDTGKESFGNLIASALPGLQINSVDAICKKILVYARTQTGSGAVQNGQFSFEVDCSVTPKNGSDSVDMVAGIDCYVDGYSLTLLLKTQNALSGLLAWLSELIGGDSLGFIQDILNNDKFFGGVDARQLQVILDIDDQGAIFLSSFGVKIEVSTSFGKSGSSPVVFLVSYTWAKDVGGAGTLSGEFWNWFDSSETRDLGPGYESAEDLCPLAQNPALVISIPSMIPGETIENIPANIPTEITEAYAYLSQNECLLSGVVQSIAWDSSQQYSVPKLDLGLLSLSASFAWGKVTDFQFALGVSVQMIPSTSSKHQDTANLTGSLSYNSGDKTWALTAALDGLYASTLYEFFDESSADHVMPLIDSIEIDSVSLSYKYTAQSGQGAATSAGTYLHIDGLLVVATLDLALDFTYSNNSWTFSAKLSAQNDKATLGDILQSILGDDDLDLPDFLANTPFNSDQGNVFQVDVQKGQVEAQQGQADAGGNSAKGDGGQFQFVASLGIGPLLLTFAQFHGSSWPATTPSKRLVKVSLTELPHVDIALVGSLEQPFDEMYYMWIQDATQQNQDKVPGLSREDIVALNPSLGDYPLVAKDKFQKPTPQDLLMASGSHFGIIIRSANGKTCILDYNFKQQAASGKAEGGSGTAQVAASDPAPASAPGTDSDPGADSDSDGSSAEAPFKKKAGPLSISNLGLKYSDKTLHVKVDATLDLGPLSLSMLGFSIDLKLTSLDLSKIEPPSFSLEGFSMSINKAPLSIAGIIRHGNDGTLNYYAGGLIVGWVPYQLEAAGFYGEATPQGAAPFTSVFVFARLDGPLVTLEFAEISGVTGGFGYKSEVRVPTIDQITDFPFVATQKLDGASDSALNALVRLVTPSQDGWFAPLDNNYWAAAGLKVDAFEMISIDAVLVVQFGTSVKIGLYGVARTDIPNASSPVKLAHVELGIAITIDPDMGILMAEAQLSPNSYILDPACHLTGGFALCYWYDGPHANKDLIGNFVFTLGGYHQAFLVPKGWPNPPRLGISWDLGPISITGQAFFAITPKACMAGGRLHASYSAGPIGAWFDAFANFLINYKPFHFFASAGICVGVSFSIDFLFIHIHISVEISAELDLWGPPVAGRVCVDIKIAKIYIHFGAQKTDQPAVSLLEFYHLVLQASSQPQNSLGQPSAAVAATAQKDTQPKNEGHVFLAQSGLMNNSDKPARVQNQDWTVRGGTFSFVVGCKIAIDSAALVDHAGITLNSVAYTDNSIYAKPMHLETPLSSSLQVTILQKGVADDDAKWGMDKVLKSVPRGLWAIYDVNTDPTGGQNNIDELLNSDNTGVTLMMGAVLTAPPPILSQDLLPVFDIADATLVTIQANPFPPSAPSQDTWAPDVPAQGSAQWDAVHGRWKNPSWDTAGNDVQTQFVSSWAQAFTWAAALEKLARLPTLLDKRFNEIYIGAPLMTK